jgi:hypothetical protein
MTYEGKKKTINTPLGGFCTIVTYLIMLLVFIKVCHDMVFARNVSSIRSLIHIPMFGSLTGAVKLDTKRFDTSVNMVINMDLLSGFVNFNWFDNKYIRAVIY